MSFARIAVIAAAMLFLSGAAATAAGPYRPFQVGLWSGGAYTDDRTGGFSHCSAGVAYDSGINLFVVSTVGHGWWLGFWNPQWSLTPNAGTPNAGTPNAGTPNAGTPIKLQFDGRPPVELLGTVAGGQTLLVPMPDDSGLLDKIQRSSQLIVMAQDQSFSLNLGGTNSVVSELTSCVHTPLADVPHPPSSATPPPAPATLETRSLPLPPAAPPASLSVPEATRQPQMRYPTELEEVRLARNFLLAARLPSARLIETDKPAALARFSGVWRSNDATGAVMIVPSGRNVTGVTIASELITVDPRLCKGNFASARSSEVVDSGVVFIAVLSCTEAQNELTAQYFITPRHNGGFVVFAVIGGLASDGQRIDLFKRAAVQAAGPGD